MSTSKKKLRDSEKKLKELEVKLRNRLKATDLALLEVRKVAHEIKRLKKGK